MHKRVYNFVYVSVIRSPQSKMMGRLQISFSQILFWPQTVPSKAPAVPIERNRFLHRSSRHKFYNSIDISFQLIGLWIIPQSKRLLQDNSWVQRLIDIAHLNSDNVQVL